jgi:basic membrane lipoprotein Med (substrate-binding protein (PBP1-ABC) superfamily)
MRLTGLSRIVVCATAALAAALGCAALATAPTQRQRADIIWYSVSPTTDSGSASAANSISPDGTPS